MASFKEKIEKLNPQQREAVESIEGPLLVIAGPGSGKTEILGLRTANILDKVDIYPNNILCLTFTDSAAVNMRQRLSEIIGRDAYRVAIYTFHGFSTAIINSYPEYFYQGASFYPADEFTQMDVLGEIFKEMDYENPLRKEHPEQGFTYLNQTKKAITNLKKAGLTPEAFNLAIDANEDAIGYINEKIEVFDDRLSVKNLKNIKEFIIYLKEYKGDFPIRGYDSLPHAVARILEGIVEESEETDKTGPLSDWKGRYTSKNDEGKRVFRDHRYTEKMRALCDVYRGYLFRMHERGYYDFDDMLLSVLEALKKNKELLSELQERYQYVLVDEFQDTNDAQMRLLELIAEAEVNEERPNIMAVGDDDQAIYKFQGADISNIHEFKKNYPTTKVVTLTQSYRSRQNILDIARYIILKGRDRLESRFEEIKKDLVAASKDNELGNIESIVFSSRLQEYHWVAGEIKKLVEKGDNPKGIAVIARQHKDLQSLSPFLEDFGIPVSYERQRNVLFEPHIHQIIQIARFVDSVVRENKDLAEEYLPEIISFPFWGIEREMIWEISLRSSLKRGDWLKAMLSHKDEKVRRVARFILDLSQHARHEPAEYVLDRIIGSSEISVLPETEDEEVEKTETEGKEKLKSPFREYYFNKKILDKEKGKYIAFLSALQVFVRAFREYKQGRFLRIGDLVEFVNLHEKNNLPITDQSPFVSAQEAVRLLSVHKAKGLEFDTVFVLSCQDNVWASAERGSMLPFPVNMPIAPAGDTIDDQLRLLYVAVTRAKNSLYLTSFNKEENGKESLRLQFLVPGSEEKIANNVKGALTTKSYDKFKDPEEIISILSKSWDNYNRGPYLPGEEGILKEIVSNYHMSVTHLNNFLDVFHGGPQRFLEHNLLRFPKAKTPSQVFGSAMHKAMENFYLEFKKRGRLPLKEELSGFFEVILKGKRLGEEDLKLYLKKGTLALEKFYDEKRNSFNLKDKVEVSFKDQGVLVGEAHLEGKIDKMIFKKGGEVEVFDFKTGHPADKWEGVSKYEKLKLYKYKRQILFYKILVENSRDFGKDYFVKKGVLEFLEPLRGKIISLSLEISKEEVERLKILINAVYRKIVSLNFPDIGKYSKDIKGVKNFEDDLLSGN